MEPDEKALYDHIVLEYRQEVDRTRWALVRANAQSAAKDLLIEQLRALVPEPAPETAAPKPGPPPAR